MMPDGVHRDVDGLDDPSEEVAQKQKGETYYLFIAIDHYVNDMTKDENPLTNLNNPVRDVNMVMNCLEKYYMLPEITRTKLSDSDNRYQGSDLCSFEGTTLQCFFNEAATKDKIIGAIEQLITDNKLGEHDSLLVYFSGHGYYKALNGQFYLIPAEGSKDKPDGFNLNEISNYFNTYQQNNRCRDLLLILDCCYSGSVQFGQVGNIYDPFFSRYALTSSGNNEKAMDGRPGKGSPFVQALTEVLTSNAKPVLSINEVENALSSKLRTKTRGNQSLIYAKLPVAEHGKGAFEFYLKQQQKPRIDLLKDSFFEHLDFEIQKGTLTSKFSRQQNSINILTTVGDNFESQKLLSKVLFKWIFKRRIKYSNGHIPIPVEVSNQGSNSISDILCNYFFDDPIEPSKQVKAISDHLMGKLSGNLDTANQKCKHVLLWIGFKIGTEQWMEDLQDFCIQLKSKFLEAYSTLDEATASQLGRLFIILSDERNREEEYEFKKIDEDHDGKYNLLLLPAIEPINLNHFEDWKEAAIEDIEIKLPEITETCVFPAGANEADVKDFIQQVCAFCEYTDQEKQELYTLLYDFQNQLF